MTTRQRSPKYLLPAWFLDLAGRGSERRPPKSRLTRKGFLRNPPASIAADARCEQCGAWLTPSDSGWLCSDLHCSAPILPIGRIEERCLSLLRTHKREEGQTQARRLASYLYWREARPDLLPVEVTR